MSTSPAPEEPGTQNGNLARNSPESVIQTRRILIADDNPDTVQKFKKLLETEGGIAVDTANDGKEALEMLTRGKYTYSIFLTDLKMPGLDGLELIKEIQKHSLSVTVIVMTAYGSIEEAVQAMQLGASNFLTKPVDEDHMRLVIDRALRERALQDEVLYLREELKSRFSFHKVISKNPRMHAVFDLINNIAQSTTTVLIEGPTGTGKEVIAEAIHQASQAVRPGPFVAVNCAALPETLLESELFGHEKGSFTGAIGQRQGRFEMAHGGTLFLDELGEIPLSIQAKLLRVLQERRFERVGGTKSIEVDIRLIAATNRPLSRLVKKGQFREDLYYRVNVVRIELPRLRDRAEDIPLLAAHFVSKHAKPRELPRSISPEAMEILITYPWPGNIRELANVIERACVICKSEVIEPQHLAPELTRPARRKIPFNIDLQRPLPEVIQEVTAALEKEYLEKALKKSRGNVSRCADICGLSRRSVTAKIAEYNIDKKALQDDND